MAEEIRKHTLSRKQRNKKKKAWYKEKVDELDLNHKSLHTPDENGMTPYKRMKVNYDLFNNILDLDDLKQVCKPFADLFDGGPVKITNKDIISGKIKVLLGMESKRPFPYRILATNPEATTRREEEEFRLIKEYVVNSIVAPIREEIELQAAQEIQGRELTDQEVQEIRQSIEEQIEARTPESVKKYMSREYQDPAEQQSHQLLELLIEDTKIKDKFNTCFKHACLSAGEYMYVGNVRGKPDAIPVNSLRFNFDRSPDNDFVEDGEWATYEFRMTPSEVVSFFPDELTENEINRIYEAARNRGNYDVDGEHIDLFAVNDREEDYDNSRYITVLHCVWKAPRKIGFLKYVGLNGEVQETMVDETYVLNPDFGDLEIEWEYPPETHEAWKIKISDPIYVRMRPIPGQFKDPDNLYESKLPYYGINFDGLNSKSTAPIDRLKNYQYSYNTIHYRIDKLAASDKGKRALMNINAVPDKIGMKKWQQFAEDSPYMWFDPNQEGTTYNDVNTIAKILDFSLISDIKNYLELAEHIRMQAGRSIGITDEMEGQSQPRQAVRNVQQNLMQSSNIIEPYFMAHDLFKKNVLTALLETAIVTYSSEETLKLPYVLDDLSVELLNVDIGLLDRSTLGIYVSDSGEVQEIKQTIEQLAHAAMQNGSIEMSDVLKVMKQKGLLEAEETLRLAEDRRREFELQRDREQTQALAEENERQHERARELHEQEKEKIILKEEQRRETEIIKAALLGASFNPDLDKDRDGENDFLEIARKGIETQIKQSKEQREREEFEHKKEVDKKKLEQQDKKLEIDRAKTKVQNKAG